MDCDRLYCSACTTGPHSQPDGLTHRRGPVSEASMLRKRCPDHPGALLRYYCESCRAACCADCRAVGAHQGLAHVCVGLPEALRAKRAQMQHLVDGVLHARRDSLAAQMRRVEERVAEVRGVRAVIERETRAEYEAVLDRLSGVEARKLAVLQGDLAALQMDLDACSALEARIGQSAGDGAQLLANFDDAVAACERAAAKSIHSGSAVRADDFPHEVAQKRQQLTQTAATTRLLRIKDMALSLLNEEAQAAVGSVRTMQSAMEEESGELQHWMALCEKLSASLRTFDRACHFCGTMLTDSSLNTACRRNVRVPPSSAAATAVALSTVTPPQDVFGTGRHYFVSVEKSRVSFS